MILEEVEKLKVNEEIICRFSFLSQDGLNTIHERECFFRKLVKPNQNGIKNGLKPFCFGKN